MAINVTGTGRPCVEILYGLDTLEKLQRIPSQEDSCYSSITEARCNHRLMVQAVPKLVSPLPSVDSFFNPDYESPLVHVWNLFGVSLPAGSYCF